MVRRRGTACLAGWLGASGARHTGAPSARSWPRSSRNSVALLLSASPYLTSAELVDTLLQLAFRMACFGADPAPHTQRRVRAKVDRGRERAVPMTSSK